MSIPCPVVAPCGTEYPSLTKAATATRTDRHRIVAMIEEGGHGWRWRDGERPDLPKRKPNGGRGGRPVIRPGGHRYDTTAEAARDTRIAASTIRGWCRSPRSDWRYEDEPAPRAHRRKSPPPPAPDTSGLRPGLYADDVPERGYRAAKRCG